MPNYKINSSTLETYDINKLQNLEQAKREDAQKASEFLNSMFAWMQTMSEYAGTEPEKFYDQTTDSINEGISGEDLKNETKELLEHQRVINENTVGGAWKSENSKILKVAGGFLSRGGLANALKTEKYKNATDKEKAEFYVDYIAPMIDNEGKLYKDLITEYGKSQNVPGILAASTAGDLYKKDMKEIHESISPEVQTEINNIYKERNLKNANAQKKEQKKADNIIINEEKIENNNEIKVNPDELQLNPNELPVVNNPLDEDAKKIKNERIKENKRIYNLNRERLYEDKGLVNAPTYRRGVELFNSTKILAAGPEGTTHSLVNKAVYDYSNFLSSRQNANNVAYVEDMKPDEQKRTLAEQLYKIDNVRVQTLSYITSKTKNGLPNTPAGKDRLLGAYVIREHADDFLKTTEADIKRLGFANNLSDFRNSREYIETASRLASEELSKRNKIGKGNARTTVDDIMLVAEQTACNIKLHPEKFKRLNEQYKDKSLTDIQTSLMNDKTFVETTKTMFRTARNNGATVAQNNDKLINDYDMNLTMNGLDRINNNLKNTGNKMKL